MNYYSAIESTKLAYPDEHRGAAGPLDVAKTANGLPLPTLERFLDDLKTEPQWRHWADRDCDYYDNNQLDKDTLGKLEDKGLGPLMRNIVKPTIDAVLGLEERTRTDWKVVSDFDDQQDTAEVLSVKLAEAERESHADRAISDAYAGQIKSGFAAVEVSRATNPFKYRYRVEPIHRRELYWDPRSRKHDWSDARFILRKRWFDVDIAALHFPEHAKLIQYSSQDWQGWEAMAQLTNDSDTMNLAESLDQERGSGIDAGEWKDAGRKRVCIYECWYRVYHRGWILRLPRGRVVEYNQANPQHLAVVAAGVVTPIESVYDKIRCAYFVGPHRVADFGTKRRHYPYVPFWGYREDLTGAPYGLIRSMVSVQDEVNARLAKMMALLASRRTVIDSDAPDPAYNTHTDLSHEVAALNSYIVLNPNRRNAQAFSVDENLQLAEAQRAALTDAVQAMPMVSGVYAALMGQTTSTTAASALRQLIDQGTTTLAEINGNYSFGRRSVGDALLDLLKEDLATTPENVTIDTGTSKKQVYINRQTQGPEGVPIIENSVDAAQVKVQLADVPSTPSYRQEQFAQMTEVTKSLSPELQSFVTPFLIEASDMPKRQEIAKLLREKLGITGDPDSPEAQAQAQQAQQQQAAEAEQLAKKFDADLAEQQAKTAKLQAETQAVAAKAAAPEAGPDGAAAGAEAALRRDYEAQIADLKRKLAEANANDEIKVREIQAKAEAEDAKAREETLRERIRAESAAEVAVINADAKKAESGLKLNFQALSKEIDAQLRDLAGEIKDVRKEAKAKK